MLDSITHQNFFSPIISKRSMDIGNKKEKHIFLYNEHKLLTSKKEQIVKEKLSLNDENHKKKLISENSEKISEDLLKKMIERLFDVLDVDNNKLICENDIKNEHLSENEMKLLSPLLEAFKKKENFNYEEFFSFIQKIMCCYKDKKILKDWYMNHKNKQSPKCSHNKLNDPQFSFHVLVFIK